MNRFIVLGLILLLVFSFGCIKQNEPADENNNDGMMDDYDSHMDNDSGMMDEEQGMMDHGDEDTSMDDKGSPETTPGEDPDSNVVDKGEEIPVTSGSPESDDGDVISDEELDQMMDDLQMDIEDADNMSFE